MRSGGRAGSPTSIGESLFLDRGWFAALLLADVESQQGENLFHLRTQLTGERVPEAGAKRFFDSAISHWSSGDYSGLPQPHYSYQSHRALNSSSRGNPHNRVLAKAKWLHGNTMGAYDAPTADYAPHHRTRPHARPDRPG